MRALVQALLLFLTLGLVGSSAALVQRALALPAPAPLTLTSFRLSMAVGEGRYMSLSDIEAYGRRCGIKLVSKVTGPYLRIEAFAVGDGADPQSSSDNGNGNDLLRTGVGSTEQLIGYCTAFIRPVPFNLLQLDTIQVKNRRQTLGFKREQWTVDGPGISFIMGSWALRWGWDRGCRRAELLAVKDSELMHKVYTPVKIRACPPSIPRLT